MEFSTPEQINGKHYYKNSNEVKELLNTTEDYFPISIESLSSIINISIAKFNLDVNFIIKNDIEYMLGNTLGRQLEYLLSEHISPFNTVNLHYKQGNEGNEPDLKCIENDIYSIEVKTSKTLIKDPNKCRPIITGNSSYARDKQDETSKKTKNHYYILINYKYENYKIINYKAWFGFILQSDWLIPNKGAASKLNIDNIEVQKRLVEIC